MLSIPNRATMPVISVIRDQIVRSLDDDDATIINVTHVTDADLSLVQLIEAARVHARTIGKSIEISASANDMLTILLHRAGFVTDPSPDNVDFWFHGVLPQ